MNMVQNNIFAFLGPIGAPELVVIFLILVILFVVPTAIIVTVVVIANKKKRGHEIPQAPPTQVDESGNPNQQD